MAHHPSLDRKSFWQYHFAEYTTLARSHLLLKHSHLPQQPTSRHLEHSHLSGILQHCCQCHQSLFPRENLNQFQDYSQHNHIHRAQKRYLRGNCLIIQCSYTTLLTCHLLNLHLGHGQAISPFTLDLANAKSKN